MERSNKRTNRNSVYYENINEIYGIEIKPFVGDAQQIKEVVEKCRESGMMGIYSFHLSDATIFSLDMLRNRFALTSISEVVEFLVDEKLKQLGYCSLQQRAKMIEEQHKKYIDGHKKWRKGAYDLFAYVSYHTNNFRKVFEHESSRSLVASNLTLNTFAQMLFPEIYMLKEKYYSIKGLNSKSLYGSKYIDNDIALAYWNAHKDEMIEDWKKFVESHCDVVRPLLDLNAYSYTPSLLEQIVTYRKNLIKLNSDKLNSDKNGEKQISKQ